MSLHILPSTHGNCFVTMADLYEYRDFLFEFHPYLGPSLCRKNGELRSRQPGERSRFWPAFEEWNGLSKVEKEATRWSGRQS